MSNCDYHICMMNSLPDVDYAACGEIIITNYSLLITNFI